MNRIQRMVTFVSALNSYRADRAFTKAATLYKTAEAIARYGMLREEIPEETFYLIEKAENDAKAAQAGPAATDAELQEMAKAYVTILHCRIRRFADALLAMADAR
jgi:hypothetical protein